MKPVTVLDDPELAAALRERAVRDQEVRAAGGTTPEKLARWRAVDAANARWMREVLRQHGWPGRRLVGDQGVADAALLVQHADGDRELQRVGLGLLVETVDAGDAAPNHVAYLVDRLHLHRGTPQRYGTQYARGDSGAYRMVPVDEPAGLDGRRRSLGLEPVAEFERRLAAMHGAEVLTHAHDAAPMSHAGTEQRWH